MRQIVGWSPDRVKPKTIKLVFVASLLSLQNSGERAKTGWLGIRIMCPSGVTCLPADLFQWASRHKNPTKRVGLGQKPLNNDKYKLMFLCHLYFFMCLCLTVWICKIFFIFYRFKTFLFLEHEQDIINNWSICVRIKITLIKESKNKNRVALSLKKNHRI